MAQIAPIFPSDLDPQDPEVHQRIVELLTRNGDVLAAHEEELRYALATGRFQGAQARWERAFSTLIRGRMPEGWEDYEARWDIPGLIRPARSFPQARWMGEPFEGRTLLLHYEQGFGDTIMFIRYASLVKALGGQVVVEVQPSLADLVGTCPGVDQVIPRGDDLPPFDFQAPLLSLPWIFRTDLSSIPAEIPYLDVPATVPNRDELTRVLAAAGDRVRIGLVWAGNPVHPRDLERSLPPSALEPLAGLEGVAWYSFQLGCHPPPIPGVLPLEPILKNFSDTAYALSGMDLVVTVDTALAHLAGALGIPTFLLVTRLPDWRWLMDRADSPWYPTMRIYRQETPGEWAPVITRVVADLASGEDGSGGDS